MLICHCFIGDTDGTTFQQIVGLIGVRCEMKIGKKNRKISRALLITEASNYDFGIGNSEALFEALIIYTRVYSSYLDSIYTFNLAVANLEKLNDSVYKSVDKLN